MNDTNTTNESNTSRIDTSQWQRLLYMLLFAILLHIASLTLWVLVSLQFLFALLSGKDNTDLRQLGSAISSYIHQSLDFLTYNTEVKPFPFSPWPNHNQSDPTVVAEQTVEADKQE